MHGLVIRYMTKIERERLGEACPIVLERNGIIHAFYDEDELDTAIEDAVVMARHSIGGLKHHKIVDQVSPIRDGALTGGRVISQEPDYAEIERRILASGASENEAKRLSGLSKRARFKALYGAEE